MQAQILKQNCGRVPNVFFLITSASPLFQLVQRIQTLLQLLFSLQVINCFTIQEVC